MKIWVQGARPRTLPASLAPVLVATALAQSQAQLDRAFLALIVSIFLQIGVNYANDYSDGVRGSDNDRVGPIRLVASGLASARAVSVAAIIAFSIAAVAGLVLAVMTTWWLVAVGVIALFAAWAYTGGKRPYGYSGYGEISVFIFFGLVATMGSFYVQTQRLTLQSFIVAIPIGSIACALLAINNIRDRAQDSLVGKRTLAVRLGDRASRNFFITLLVIAHTCALLTFTPWALLTLLVLPLTASISRSVRSGVQGLALIPLLAKTGQLQLLFAGLLATAMRFS